MTLTGVDVSKYQATSPAFANYEFMFARATYGLKTDPMFATHIANAKKAGIVTGAYHFGYASSVATPEAQAAEFMRVALLRDADLWALDLEGSDAPMTNTEAKRFIAAVHVAGYRIGLYHSRSNFPFTLGQDFDWIADWDATVFPAHAEFWQYRGNPVDLDKFNGTIEQLKALAAVPPEDPVGIDIIIGDTVGDLAIPAGTDAIRVSTGDHYKVPTTVTRSAVTAQLAPAGSSGFAVNLDGNAQHFIRGSEPVKFSVSVPVDLSPFTQADIDAAVRAATEGLFTKAEVDALIQADRAKARPVLSVSYE